MSRKVQHEIISARSNGRMLNFARFLGENLESSKMRKNKLLAAALLAATAMPNLALAEDRISWKYAEIMRLSGDRNDLDTDGTIFSFSAMISDKWYFNGEYHSINNDEGADFDLDHTSLSVGWPIIIPPLNNETFQFAPHFGVSFEHVDTIAGDFINQTPAGQPGAGTNVSGRRESGYGYHVGVRAKLARIELGLRIHEAFFSNGPDETFLRASAVIQMAARMNLVVNFETLEEADIDEFQIGLRIDLDGA